MSASSTDLVRRRAGSSCASSGESRRRRKYLQRREDRIRLNAEEARALFTYPLREDAYLRILERRDAESLFDLTDRARAHLRRWLPWLDQMQRLEDTEAFVASALRQYADGLGMQAGIWCGERLAGVAGLHPIDWPNRQSALGYWVAPEYEGRGLVTLACRALLQGAFAEYGLHRMELRAATGNARSRAVAERLSFALEGVARDAEWLYDHYVDHAIYSLLEQEWRTGR